MSQIYDYRISKNKYFASSEDSPLTKKRKTEFSSLQYYEENNDLIFHLSVAEFNHQETLAIPTTSGAMSTYTSYGKVEFEVHGLHVGLTLFQNTNSPAQELFIPFKDATTGFETYAGGRYLQPHPTSGRKITLDFNFAYNPYCAYNSSWSCPIVPVENILPVPIHAGEKLFR